MTEPLGNVTLCKQIVSDYFRVPMAALETHLPARAWCWPRMIAIWLAQHCCPEFSMTQIAGQFRRDVSSTLDACATIDGYRRDDALFASLLDTLATIYRTGAGRMP